MLFEIKEIDRRFYNENLADFLPTRLIDIHTHIWLKDFRLEVAGDSRSQDWPRKVAEDNTIEDLLQTYQLMLPQQEVTPLLFGWPDRDVELQATNAYVSHVAGQKDLPALIVSRPEWTVDELVGRVHAGGFIGLKPYLNWAPRHIPAAEVSIYDFLPPKHLQAADDHGWLVVLHIPRPDRLRDALNLQQLVEIDSRYPHVKLVIAHLGRAYCLEDVGDAFEVLKNTRRMVFDFSANTNSMVMEMALRAVGPERVVFGSDLPIPRMRMRRICEHGTYINLVPPGLYGDVSGDEHMREVSQEQGEQLSFFLYEELNAFRRAAENVGLSAADIAIVFYHNAKRLIGEINKGGARLEKRSYP
jgi:hypothetical protein